MFGLANHYDNGLGVLANSGLTADWMMFALKGGSFQATRNVMTAPHQWSPEFRKQVEKRLRETGVNWGKIDRNIGSGRRQAIANLPRKIP